MKKKLAVLLIGIFACITIVGCEEKTISGDVSNKEQVETKKTNDKNGDDAEATDGYVFKSGDVSIAIGAESDALIQALGEPISTYESPSCAFGDLDVYYTYAGFEVDTYQMNGVNYISNIILKDDSVTTPEGLYIGMSADEIEKAIGAPDSKDGGNYVYSGSNMKLVIFVSGDKIDAIEYQNTIV